MATSTRSSWPVSAALTDEATITFENGPGDWEQVVTSAFDAPIFSYDAAGSGSLALSPGGSDSAFGYWSSRNPVVTLDPAKMYFVEFTVRSSATEPAGANLPSIRLRLNETELHMATMARINYPGENTPSLTNLRRYIVSFVPMPGTDGSGLLLAFDLISFDPNADLEATL